MVIKTETILAHLLNEIETSFARSSGPGGQNVNKVNSKCIVRWNFNKSNLLDLAGQARFLEIYGHRISENGDLVVSSDKFRDQKRNFEDCLIKIATLIDVATHPPKPRKKTKLSKASRKKRAALKKFHSEKKEGRRKRWD